MAAAFLIFFGAYLRKVLEPGAGLMLAILPLIGIAIVAIGAAIDSMLMFAAAEAVDDIPAPEIQTIQAIWDNDFLPLILGVLVFNWSVGFAVLRSGALPKWMGWCGDRLRGHLAGRADRIHRCARCRALDHHRQHHARRCGRADRRRHSRAACAACRLGLG